jgi:hypothetical protein
MAERRGGYRRPGSPAPASGPGRLSRRTDGGPQQTTQPMTGMGYGENQEFNAVQGGAPLAATPSASNARARKSSPADMMGVAATPLFAPTAFPDEPLTAGAGVGPGAGPEMNPGRSTIAEQDAQVLGKYLPSLMAMADAPDTPDGFKRFVRHLRNMQGGM